MYRTTREVGELRIATVVPFVVTALLIGVAPRPSHALVSSGKVRVVDPVGQPTDAAFDRNARVMAVGGGVWIAAWDTDNTLGGTIGADEDILFARSTDDGATWSTPAALNSRAAVDGTSARDLFVDVAADMSGVVIAIWQSSGIGGAAYARSIDGGLTWSAAALIGIGGSEPRIVTDGAGVWLAVWSSTADLGGTIGTDDDILYSRSVDNGLTWSPVAVLNSDAATDGIKDDVLPQIAGDGAGTWVATWGSGARVGVSSSFDNGLTWTPVVLADVTDPDRGGSSPRPSIGTDGAGKWLLVWDGFDPGGSSGTGSDVDLFLVTSSDDGLTWSSPVPVDPDAVNDDDFEPEFLPALVRGEAGVWYVISASNTNFGGVKTDTDLMINRSVDNGVTWTSKAVLNTNANKDVPKGVFTDTERERSVAYDGVSKWVVVWESAFPYDGKLDVDNDILFATSSDGCPATPTPTCRATLAPRKSRVKIKDHPKGKDALDWKWKGEATSLADFSDPVAGTDYVLCVYDDVAGVPRLTAEQDIPGGQTCKKGAACWTAKAGVGFDYKDAALDHGGVKKARLAAGAEGKAKLSLKSKGPFVAPPRLPLAQSPSVVVQLYNLDTGTCWSASYSTSDRNEPEQFKASSD